MTQIVISEIEGSILNLLTSSCFIITTIHAFYRNCELLMYGCMLCLMTSWLYHGSRTLYLYTNYNFYKWLIPKVRLVDMGVCQSCVIYFTYMCASFHWLYIFTLCTVFYIFMNYYVFGTSKRVVDGYIWHASIHVIANIGICCLIESCYHTIECVICN